MERYTSKFEPQVDYKLLETLYAIQRDVDFIYNKCFKKFVDDYNNNSLKDLDRYTISSNNDFDFLTSSELQTKLCKKAHESNPISIFCGVYKGPSFYDFGEHKIQITLNIGIIKLIYSNRFLGKHDLEKVISKNNAKSRMIRGEIAQTKIKASIAHEIAHWIDESKYSVMSRILDGEKDPVKRKELLSLGYEDVDMTYFEIQSQIHGIKQLKNKYRYKWDELSFEDLFEKYPPLYMIANKLKNRYDDDTLGIWIHYLIRRMGRENLIGKNMRFPIKLENVFIESTTRI